MTRGNAQPRGRHHVGTLAGFKSERVAGFRLECMAGFVGIRTDSQCEPPECLFSHFVSVLDGIVRTSNGMSLGQSSLDLAERVFM